MNPYIFITIVFLSATLGPLSIENVRADEFSRSYGCYGCDEGPVFSGTYYNVVVDEDGHFKVFEDGKELHHFCESDLNTLSDLLTQKSGEEFADTQFNKYRAMGMDVSEEQMTLHWLKNRSDFKLLKLLESPSADPIDLEEALEKSHYQNSQFGSGMGGLVATSVPFTISPKAASYLLNESGHLYADHFRKILLESVGGYPPTRFHDPETMEVVTKFLSENLSPEEFDEKVLFLFRRWDLDLDDPEFNNQFDTVTGNQISGQALPGFTGGLFYKTHERVIPFRNMRLLLEGYNLKNSQESSDSYSNHFANQQQSQEPNQDGQQEIPQSEKLLNYLEDYESFFKNTEFDPRAHESDYVCGYKDSLDMEQVYSQWLDVKEHMEDEFFKKQKELSEELLSDEKIIEICSQDKSSNQKPFIDYVKELHTQTESSLTYLNSKTSGGNRVLTLFGFNGAICDVRGRFEIFKDPEGEFHLIPEDGAGIEIQVPGQSRPVTVSFKQFVRAIKLSELINQ